MLTLRGVLALSLLELGMLGSCMAGPAASGQTPQWVCLRHVGQEDKPMPKVCLTVQAQASDASYAAFDWWQLTPQAWLHLMARIRDAKQAQPPFEFGAYRIEGPEGGAGNPVLPRQAMYALLSQLAPGAKPLSSTFPEGLVMLQKRLAP